MKAGQSVGAVIIKGNEGGKICHVNTRDNINIISKKESLVSGEIYKFAEIDLSGEWFSNSQNKIADKEDIKKIFIPKV